MSEPELWARADMESANPEPIVLIGCACVARREPERLSAFLDCGATGVAMMGENVSMQVEGSVGDGLLGGTEGFALNFLVEPSDGLTEDGLITQHGVADACEFIGECAGRFVVMGACLELDCPAADAA